MVLTYFLAFLQLPRGNHDFTRNNRNRGFIILEMISLPLNAILSAFTSPFIGAVEILLSCAFVRPSYAVLTYHRIRARSLCSPPASVALCPLRPLLLLPGKKGDPITWRCTGRKLVMAQEEKGANHLAWHFPTFSGFDDLSRLWDQKYSSNCQYLLIFLVGFAYAVFGFYLICAFKDILRIFQSTIV